MSPDRWRRVDELYHAALEHESESRGAFLSEACGPDAELREEVESLLAQGDAADSPLERPAWSGGRFGPYVVLGELGSGGMGTVYKALDPRLNRTVALKVMKAPFSDRFQREALAIAALNHPRVCTLYDVGPDY